MTDSITEAPRVANRPSHPSTPGEDAITLAIGAWLIGGLFLDGYAHANIIDTETEDFFTPWHAVFYASFAALVAWVYVLGRRREGPGPILDWFPAGYRTTVIGLAVFAVGGVGDGIWHTIFGVEVGIDALLSPTHLVLFVGALLLLWTPVRSAAARGDTAPWLPLGAVALTTAFLVFFIEYMFTLSETWLPGTFFDPRTNAGWEYVALFLASVIVQTVVLLGPLLIISARWRLPFGAATGVWLLAAFLEMAAFDQADSAVWATLVGGLAFDLCGTITDIDRRRRVSAFVGPAAIFAGYFWVANTRDGVEWPAEIWTGAIVMAGLTGLGLLAVQNSGRHEPLSAVR